MAKELWKGNEAIAEAAIRAGCDCFFGYPITPQSEVPEYLSLHLPQHGKVFVQAESEVAAINMVYGAAGAGMRAMTSSSSPGVSLKQEGITYIAGAELPAVIVNCMRGGPGLGTIQPAQGDYFQATRGGGNGDYRTVVLAPSNVQEAVDFVQEAFDIADQYRNPVVVLADGLIGQMMEPIEWHDKYRTIAKNEVRWDTEQTEDCELLITAYGTPARIVLTALEQLRAAGVKAGLFRPITLWPFPEKALHDLAGESHVKAILDVEMSIDGQMIDDVRLAVEGQKPISYLGHAGGVIPTVEEMVEAGKKALKEAK